MKNHIVAEQHKAVARVKNVCVHIILTLMTVLEVIVGDVCAQGGPVKVSLRDILCKIDIVMVFVHIFVSLVPRLIKVIAPLGSSSHSTKIKQRY